LLNLNNKKQQIVDEISPDSVLTKYFLNFKFEHKLTGFVHNIFVLGVCVGHLDAD
jgi:hypothetical protein